MRRSLVLVALAVAGSAQAADTGRRLVVVAAPPAQAGVGAVQIEAYDDALLPDLGRPGALNAVVGDGAAKIVASTAVSAGQKVTTVLAFDQSGSFQRAWAPAFALANAFADALPAGGAQTVEVLTFGQQLVEQGSAANTVDLKALLSKVQRQGARQPYTRLRSFIQDAVQIAHNQLPLSDRGLRQMIVFTDAGEESQSYAVSDVIADARELGVVVDVVAFPGAGKQDAWAQRFDDVKRIAEETGGRSLLVTDPSAAMPEVAAFAAAGTRSFWLDLAYCGVSGGKGANFPDTVSVEIASGPSRGEATPAVPFRQSAAGPALISCTPPSAAPEAPAGPPVAASAPPAPSSPVWPWLALLIGLGLLGLLLLLLLTRRRPPAPAATPPAPAPPPPAPAPPADGPPADWVDPLAALPETHLVVVEGPPGLGAYVRVHRSPFAMGADPGCDLPLAVESVSGRHAEIQVYPSGTVFLTDRGATNGTFVDGRKLSSGERVPITVGQTIGLSRRVSLRLEQPGLRPPPAPPASVEARPKTKTVFAPVLPPEKKGG